jgi:hypothetical protein
MKKAFVFHFLFACLLINGYAAQQIANNPESIIVQKALPLFAYIENSPQIDKLVKQDPELLKLAAQQKDRIDLALKKCADVSCLADALQWTQTEISAAGERMIRLSQSSEQFRLFLAKLKKSGCYNLYASYSDPEFIKAAWDNAAGGVNQIMDIYVKGKKPFYAAIDSISFAPNDENFLKNVRNMLAKEMSSANNKNKAFFHFTLHAAVNVLIMNGRDEAARYEPLNEGLNKTAFENLKNVTWDKYQYSAILVPGQGPDKEGESIAPMSIERCKLAAKYYRDGLAPFLIVSGGHVHPNKTPFSEAVEMKKYLVKELSVPENAILVEPHARHTTTNMRNAARLIYRFSMPDDKKMLIVTDPQQNAFLLGMERRFMSELKCVPYRDLKKLTEETSEYYPTKNALQTNSLDPLDP